MRRLLFSALVLAACDYAPAEKVRELSRDVDKVKTEQRVLRTQVESTSDSQKILQASVSAMGSGFNVLSDSVSNQEERVDKLEVRTNTLRRAVESATGRGGAPAVQREPNKIGLYLGTRFDTRTLQETNVRTQWCEDEEGVGGYLVSQGAEPNYASLQCWRFGDVAIFREETPKGPRIQCLRSITVDDQNRNLRALDCDDGAVVYQFSLR